MSRSTRLAVLVLAATWIAGCGDPLERVAKDWCMTIRASQVIPVYPMTEDLQPGDVFLVFTPVSRQTKEYKGKGFLPLDDHVVRLHGINYDGFYAKAYWNDAYAPGEAGHPRSFSVKPLPEAEATGVNEVQGVDDVGDNKTKKAETLGDTYIAGVEAPAAAFPSYSFTLKRGSGIKVALPIKGIPFGMGLMGARSAFVTVGISDAYTYGAEKEDFLRELDRWWNDPKLRVPAKLKKAAMSIYQENKKRSKRDRVTPYLRVVTRVYMAGKMNVTLTRAGGIAFGADLGLARPFNPPTITDKDTAANYRAMLETLNGALNENPGQSDLAAPVAGTGTEPDANQDQAGTVPPADAAAGAEVPGRERLADLAAKLVPGGSIRIVQATASSVSMVETFNRPLVLGYLGFDVPILSDENLGLPLDTRGLLEGTVPAELTVGGSLHTWQREYNVRLYSLRLAWKGDRGQVRRIIVAVACQVPELQKVVDIHNPSEISDKDFEKFITAAVIYASTPDRAGELIRLLDQAFEKEQ